MTNAPDPEAVHGLELVHPFYLDTDMSMAFAAALSGGVALEREESASEAKESESVRNLRGNLRFFGGLGFGAARESKAGEAQSTEARLVRQHTEASIFIALHEELRRTRRLVEEPAISNLGTGPIVSLNLGPAVAPLRRVVDQIVRLFDLLEPLVPQVNGTPGVDTGATRQQRREQARQAARVSVSAEAPDEDMSLAQIRGLFLALRDDLDRSGMIDVVVRREDGPSVILTLDKRFTSDRTLELLHTSNFTVVGKVTQIWHEDDKIVNLYRRSVMSLVPALGQTVTWSMFAFLAGVAANVGAAEAESAAREMVGLEPSAVDGDQSDDDIRFGDDIEALNPAVSGPAVQILPLAICV